MKGGKLLWATLIFCVLLGLGNTAALYARARMTAGPYYGGEKGVALLINVYQNTEEVMSMLEILDEYGVKASFFVGGVWAKDNPAAVLAIYKAGHDVGNHGYAHKLPTKAGAAATKEEIRKTDEIITAITGEKCRLYAPPSGDFNGETVKIAEGEGYKTILWTADTIDWRDKDAELIFKRAMKLTDGGFLLTHPTPMTVRALPSIIKGLREKGYNILPVSKILEGPGAADSML